jgi:hypothetical protein
MQAASLIVPGRASVPASPNVSGGKKSGLAGTLALPAKHFGAR